MNDGSVDNTLDALKEHASADARIKVVNFSRNYGKEIALSAGLDHASGAAVRPIDCDLQDPPELIPAMVEKWREGYHMVLARRVDRASDTATKRVTSSLFYKLLTRIADVHIPENVGDYRLLDRQAVNALKEFPERSRFMKGMFATLGFREVTVDYQRPERAAGTTKWNYWKLYLLATEGIVSFTSFPLKIWSYVGATVALGSFIHAIYMSIKTLVYGLSGSANVLLYRPSRMDILPCYDPGQRHYQGKVKRLESILTLHNENKPLLVVQTTLQTTTWVQCLCDALNAYYLVRGFFGAGGRTIENS